MHTKNLQKPAFLRTLNAFNTCVCIMWVELTYPEPHLNERNLKSVFCLLDQSWRIGTKRAPEIQDIFFSENDGGKGIVAV